MAYFTTRDGTAIRYKELGEGRPVILIHGWPLSGDSWDPVMMHLADNGMRAIAYDRRGFGGSCKRSQFREAGLPATSI